MRAELINIAQKALELRELGQKRDARALIIDNKLDGSDLLHALKIDPETGHYKPEELVGIITMMDSVLDETRDLLWDANRQIKSLEA